MVQVYRYAYLPVCGTILLLGAAGVLPRVGPSTGEKVWRRRYFYGSVWAVTASQVLLLALWKTFPPHAGVESGKAGYLCVYAPVDGVCGISRDASANPPHFVRGLDRRGLKETWRKTNIWILWLHKSPSF